MCIIFASEEGNLPNKADLKIAFENNPHGVGFMWLDKGMVRTLKGLMTFTEAWNVLTLVEGRPYSCHFRYRTRGKIDQRTCHPFKITTVDGPAWLMHNGTIFSMPVSGGASDTQVFSWKLEESLFDSREGYRKLHNNAFLRTLGKKVESFNKLVFMTPMGISFANRDASGTFEMDGVWYSNGYSFTEGYRKKGKNPELLAVDTQEKPEVTKVSRVKKANGVVRRKSQKSLAHHLDDDSGVLHISPRDKSRLNYLANSSDDLDGIA